MYGHLTRKHCLQKTSRRAVEKIGTLTSSGFPSIAQGISLLFRFASSHPTYPTRPAGQFRLLTMPDPSSSIQVSCQQTRFHIAEGADNREVSLEALKPRPHDLTTLTERPDRRP
jgi:hypothetical protein